MKDTISYEDFLKVDLRVGSIVSAEPIAKSKKLLKLLVSFGAEERVIVAGVAEYYAPELLPGKKVVAVLNLAPRTMFGIESHGMLLAAHAMVNGEDDLALVSCHAPAGEVVG